MSGPPIPLPPRAGDNAIGKFKIGVSPIGSISPVDYWQTVISQYANSPIITQLVANFDAYFNQTVNLETFFDMIWNVDTAQGYGLDVWGRIVGVSRTLQVSNTEFFGFEEAGDAQTFGPGGVGPFNAGSQFTDNVVLDDTAYRTVILAKALSNICDGSIKAINQLLINLFPGRGNVYVTDGLNMTMTYTFTFALTPTELTIVTNAGVLPRPTGVLLSIVTP